MYCSLLVESTGIADVSPVPGGSHCRAVGRRVAGTDALAQALIFTSRFQEYRRRDCRRGRYFCGQLTARGQQRTRPARGRCR